VTFGQDSGVLSYGPQHGVHEIVQLIRLHQVARLQHPDGQTWYDGGMFFQSLLQYLAVTVVIFDGSNFRHTSKALESLEVRLVHVGKVWVRNNDVW
jgi:hypothetical protein